jgi:ferritin-like metal-binding protein YciE
MDSDEGSGARRAGYLPGMQDHDPQTQLVKYLTDVHSIEEQALAQMRRAPDLVEGALSAAFARHLPETEEQERRVRERLDAHDASPSTLKDLAGKAGGFGMILFARSQSDTPGKLTFHAYAYEHMEVAAYELLRLAARDAGDEATAAMAGEIAEEEREMARRLEALFDQAVEDSLREVARDDLDSLLDTYLSDAHALEAQSRKLLERGKEMDLPGSLREALARHLEETVEQEGRLERRLAEGGASPSKVKDAALRLGALNWGAFFAAQPDTPPKLAGFAYAVENLEVAGYELLLRVARRAGDEETAALAERALDEERKAAGLIADQLPAAMAAA